MKTLRSIVGLLLVILLAVPLMVSAAPVDQRSVTITLTEADVNSAYRVTQPLRRSVSNVVIDLQTNAVQISYTYTPRPRRGTQPAPINFVALYTPAIVDFRLTWTLTSATANGAPATESQIGTINSVVGNWRTFVNSYLPNPTGRVQNVTITDTQISVVYGGT
jgi:hypothetical protein